MPLTRNLYKEDEVIASMQWCSLRGRCVEAVFWATELLESAMVTEFFSALRTIWLLGFGIAALPWYQEFKRIEALEELETDVLLTLVVGLARTRGRDTSYLILAGTNAPAEKVDFCLVPKGLTGVDAFFAAAILQGRTITAWRALPSIGEGVVAAVAAYKHQAVDFCDDPAILISALCLPRGELQQRLSIPVPGMIDEVVDAVSEWDTLHGRERRVYTIPQEAIYWTTARGNTTVYETAESQLRGSLERPGRLWGSVYWDSVAEELGGWLAVRADDNTREAFYDEHFPDDIPDEWSLADREKSHGRGSLQPDTTASLKRLLQKWFGSYQSAVIWGESGEICAKKLEEITAPIGQPVELNLQRNGRRTFTVL